MSAAAPIPLSQILANLLNSLSSVFSNRTPAVPLPAQLIGGLRQADGSAGAQLQVEVLLPTAGAAAGGSSSSSSSGSATATAGPGSYVITAGLTDPSGNFELAVPKGVTLPSGQSLALRVRGGPPPLIAIGSSSSASSASSSSAGALATCVILPVPPSSLGPLGYIGTLTLPQQVSPIPTPIYLALLAGGASGGPTLPAPPSKATMPRIKLGDDADCVRVIENQSSFDQFPYGIFFRLLAPQLYLETEQQDFKGAAGSNPAPVPGVAAAAQPAGAPEAPAPAAAPAAQSSSSRSAAPALALAAPAAAVAATPAPLRIDTPIPRVDLSGPIGIADFRDSLLTRPRIVGTVGLGYVLRCAQKWTFEGIALGDLIYSLPLAPGEQQQLVIVDQQTSVQIADTETITAQQQTQSTAANDSSTQAVFSQTLNQYATGSSTQATTSTTNSGANSGGLLGIVFGGSSGSSGTTTTSGTSSSTMDGVQNYASNAAQSMQSSAAQQAMITRRGQSTSIRAASASETTSVTTKTITNHNKLHALTLQYFEALRMYDIATTFESVTLLALVPLDTVWFLPPGQPLRLPDIVGASDAASAVQLASTLANTAASEIAQLAQATSAAGSPFGLGLVVVRAAGMTLANTMAPTGALAGGATNLNNLLAGTSSPLAGLANDILNVQIPKVQAALATYSADNSNDAVTLAGDLNGASTALKSIQQEAITVSQQLSLAPAGAMSRQSVLARYAGLLANSDVLQRALPARYRSGLTRLERFAADPSATVALNSLAEDVIQISANATVLPFDHVYVSVVTRWGTRLGPVEMVPSPPVTVPGQFDVNNRFKTTQDLLQYLQTQRNPGTSSMPALQASIALTRSLSPSDVIGFEITHTTDSFSYQLAAPSEIVTSTLSSLFGSNGSSWPAPIQGLLGTLLGPVLPTPSSPPPATYVTYTPNDIATTVGPPYLQNFAANLLTGVQGNYEPYVNPATTPIELPPGVYPIPAAQVSPILKNSDLLLIESTLQHVLRYQVAYSKAVWSSLTSEERAMLLEPYLLSFTAAGAIGSSSSSASSSSSSGAATIDVPLLDCVANEVVGFYGNCMMMPFSVPPEVAVPLQTSTGSLEDALLRFHLQTAPKEVVHIALPTRGVVGEAMLGHCASGEKLDLTRFWNWQDSPGDTAPAISPVSVPGSSAVNTLATAPSPNVLASVLNALATAGGTASATPTDAMSALASALAQRAPAASVPDLSNAAGLAQLLTSTQSTAAAARQDALKSQTALVQDTIDQAAGIIKAYLGASGSSSSSKSGSSKSSSSSTSSSGGGGGSGSGNSGSSSS